MASKSREQLLQEINTAVPSGGVPGLTTASGVRNVLTTLVDELVALRQAPTAATGFGGIQLPKPLLQLRHGGAHQHSPLNTANHLRVRFNSALSPEILASEPEIWLFTYNQRRPRNRHSISWGHPSHQGGERAKGAYWGGSGRWQMDTEFYGDTYLPTLSTDTPYADLRLDGNQWFEPPYEGKARARGKKGHNYRFRFALVINAPDTHPTPSGKIISELSDEVWFSSVRYNQIIFRLGTYNSTYFGTIK